MCPPTLPHKILIWESLEKLENDHDQKLGKSFSETVAVNGMLLQRANDRTRANHIVAIFPMTITFTLVPHNKSIQRTSIYLPEQRVTRRKR